MPDPACPHCKQTFTVAELLAGLGPYAPDTAHYTAKCPRCAAWLEFQVRAERIEFGYTYWAGSMHFEGVAPHPAPGLRALPRGSAPGLHYRGTDHLSKPA